MNSSFRLKHYTSSDTWEPFRILAVLAGVVICSVLLRSPVVKAQDTTAIYWAKPDAAPIFIRSGEMKNKGIGDKVFHDLKVNLPQFRHQDTRMNHARMKAEMKKGVNICALLHKTPEREALMHFSNFAMISPSSHVYIRVGSEEDVKKLEGINEEGVDLEKLLESEGKLIIGILPDRSYGVHRDSIINRYKNNFQRINLSSGMTAPVKMLVAHRLNMIIEYPWLVRYQLSLLNSSESLKIINILKAPAYDKIYITCSKTSWGQAVMNEINKLLPGMRHQFNRYIEAWLSEGEISAYRQHISIQNKNGWDG